MSVGQLSVGQLSFDKGAVVLSLFRMETAEAPECFLGEVGFMDLCHGTMRSTSRITRRLGLGLKVASLGAVMVTVAGTMTGCVQIQNQAVTLQMKVEPAGRPGIYTVSGTTTLPDRTPVIIQGLRYLKPLGGSAKTPDHYSILARQTTRAKNGQWSATLTLWQPGGGDSQTEAWQLSPRDAKQVSPASAVVFTATTPPTYPTRNTEQQLDTRNRRPDQGAVVYTSDGEWYLLAQQSLPLAPPISPTASTKADLNDIQKVWGSNGALGSGGDTPGSIAPVTLKESRTDAPLSPNEQVR